MRVLIDAQTLTKRWSGIGNYTAELATALAADPEVEQVGLAIGLQICSVDALPQLARRKSGHMGRRMSRAVAQLGRPLVNLTRAAQLRRRHADWTLFHGANFVAPRIGLPLVTTIHDMSFLRCPQYMPADRARWIRSQMVTCLKHAGVILVPTGFVKHEVLQCYPWMESERIFVTPLGVDHRCFNTSLSPQRAAAFRERFRLPESFVLYVGTLEPRKNLAGLMAAYRRLPSAMRRQFPLVLAGGAGWCMGPIQAALEQLRREGSLFYLGYLSRADLSPLMQLATAFLFPSHYEGFGLPALEAAACGAPVLCSRVASLPEVMGDAALYVAPDSADDIAAGLHRLLRDEQLRERLREAGRLRAARFQWQQCATATIAAYRAAA